MCRKEKIRAMLGVVKHGECILSLAFWYTPIILALRRLRQEDEKFRVSKATM